MKEQHVLLDFENVQPSLDALTKLVPGFTDVWLFHGPHQAKQAQAFAAEVAEPDRAWLELLRSEKMRDLPAWNPDAQVPGLSQVLMRRSGVPVATPLPR